MEDGPTGVCGQLVEVDADRAIRTDIDLVPTPGRCTEEKTTMDMLRRRENAKLEYDVLVCYVICSFYSSTLLE